MRKAKAQKERHLTQKMSVIVCTVFCNGFALYPYYQHLPNSRNPNLKPIGEGFGFLFVFGDL